MLLATDGSLAVQRQLRDLRPIYYAIVPVEPAELRDAVHAAIARTALRGGGAQHALAQGVHS